MTYRSYFTTRAQRGMPEFAHPEERIQGAVLHELRYDHDRAAFGDHALQADDVRVVELAHDGCLGQEVPPLLLHVARLQGFDGDVYLPLAGQLQAALVHLPELTLRQTERDGVGGRGQSTSHLLYLNKKINP